MGGGVCALPSFFTIAAGAMLGSQLVLITQLAAVLSTFLLMDVMDGKIELSNYMRLGGFALVLCGVVLDNLEMDVGAVDSIRAVGLLGCVALSGVGYGLQARCNGCLAEAVGSSVRATTVSACVYIVCSLPVMWWLRYHKNVEVHLDPRHWYLWMLAGFQSAFYISSMAKLPKLIGFTTCYTITLGSKLSTSLLIDYAGWTGTYIPLNASRLVSLSCVFVGAVIFNAMKSKDDPEKPLLSSLDTKPSSKPSSDYFTVKACSHSLPSNEK